MNPPMAAATPPVASSPLDQPRYWIVVASQALVDAAVAGRFIEVSHGKAAPLARMRPGDGVACYSPRSFEGGGPPLQAFTALGRIAPSPVYQVVHDYQPFRRAVHWLPGTAAPVRPLIERLGFIRSKVHWGAAFRFGYLRIASVDFACVAAAMDCAWPDAAAHAAPMLDAVPPAGAARVEGVFA